MRKFFLLIFIVQSFTFFGQDNWAFIGLNNDISDSIVEEVIPILNDDTGYTAVFFKVKKTYVCYLLNDKQELTKTLKVESVPNNFNLLAGSAYDNQKFTLYFSNSSQTKHGCLSIDFENDNYSIYEELNLELKKERLISYVENKDVLYALSTVKNSSLLNLYRFDLEGNVSSEQFDLSNETFETDNELPITLDALLFGKHSNGSVETIDTSIPNTLETTAALTKIYLDHNVIKLTNNTFQKFTYFIQLNLNDNSIQLSKIENTKFEKKNLRTNSNSFVLDNLFFDVYSDTDEIIFNVLETENDRIMKTFHIKAGDSITFKNSPFIHEVVNTTSYRDLEKTARFIRKVNASNIGISAYPYNDNYILTIGASEQIQSDELVIIGGVLGGMIGAAIFSAFDSYSNTQSTRIECIFDKQFNHVEGDIPKNGFDLIQDFIKDKGLKRAKLQTVFKYKDKYIWGSYDLSGRYYAFYQFSPQ